MIRRLFTTHPRDVGETYLEHLVAAGGFGWRMVSGGLRCMIHAVVPAWFETSGSGTVAELHARMVAKRAAHREAGVQMRTVDFVI